MSDIVPVKQFLPAQDDPEAQLQWAQRAATALMKRVNAKKSKIVISGKQYLEFGDWQTLGSFFAATVATEWSREKIRDGMIIGYEARAIVYRGGQIVSAAEAECLRSEKNWIKSDEFALRSMAQTRACAKALRNAFGWVAELAGYASTPAEEMSRETKTVTSGKQKYPTPREQLNQEEPLIAKEQPQMTLEDRAREYSRKGTQAYNRWQHTLDNYQRRRLANIAEELRNLQNEADEEEQNAHTD